MKIDQEELNRRAAEADRARLALRRATLELLAAGEKLLYKPDESVTTKPAPAKIETLPRPSKPKMRSDDNAAESRE
jgi:hypothetical protein